MQQKHHQFYDHDPNLQQLQPKLFEIMYGTEVFLELDEIVWKFLTDLVWMANFVLMAFCNPSSIKI